jgi:hypothetical protein
LGVPADPTPMLKSILWIICMNASITIISGRSIPEDSSIFMHRGEWVFHVNGRSRLSDHGSPLLERGQPRNLEHGFPYSPGCGAPRVR